jgi:hypothetical protein
MRATQAGTELLKQTRVLLGDRKVVERPQCDVAFVAFKALTQDACQMVTPG